MLYIILNFKKLININYYECSIYNVFDLFLNLELKEMYYLNFK